MRALGMLSREQLLKRASMEARSGEHVVFGVGLPLANGLTRFDARRSVDVFRVDVVCVSALEVSAKGDVVARFAASELDPVELESNEVENGRDELGSAARLEAVLQLDAGRRIAVLPHLGPNGSSNLVVECRTPVTRRAWAHRIITDLAVIDVRPEGLCIRELAPGVSARQVQAHSEARLFAEPGLRFMEL